MDRLGSAVAVPMLDALCEAGSGRTRQILLDRLIALGPEVGPLAAGRLGDERWYVRRNMLRILGGLDELPRGFDPLRFLRNENPQVRREALKIAARGTRGRDEAICLALKDPDEALVRLALAAAQERCPRDAVSTLERLATTATAEDIRVLAVRALAASERPSARAALQRLVSRYSPLFFWRRKGPEYREARTILEETTTRRKNPFGRRPTRAGS